MMPSNLKVSGANVALAEKDTKLVQTDISHKSNYHTITTTTVPSTGQLLLLEKGGGANSKFMLLQMYFYLRVAAIKLLIILPLSGVRIKINYTKSSLECCTLILNFNLDYFFYSFSMSIYNNNNFYFVNHESRCPKGAVSRTITMIIKIH